MEDWLNCTPEFRADAIGIWQKDEGIFSTHEENKNAAEGLAALWSRMQCCSDY